MENIKYVRIERRAGHPLSPVERYGPDRAEKVRKFHRSFPEYSVTPLTELPGLAKDSGIEAIYIKDESFRFGLNAFKVLGGSYAIGRCIAKKLGLDINELPYEKLVSPEIKEQLGELCFVTATDGNHGRGVAWTASRLRQKSVVYMPRGSAEERLRNIQALGAEAYITELNYDDTVRLARKKEGENGWILLQDTSWEGYEEVPAWIMEGYTTMAAEVSEQLGKTRPTHIFLQAGVGAMAGAVCAYFSALYGDSERPAIIIVEPNKADCFYKTALANDGQLHAVTGHMDSIMAGLCCGEPCPLAWDVLRDHADCFVSIPDHIAAEGMRLLAHPLPGDTKIISGESGAATLGLAVEILRNPELEDLKNALGLSGDSRVLCFSTEGATDMENYLRIVGA